MGPSHVHSRGQDVELLLGRHCVVCVGDALLEYSFIGLKDVVVVFLFFVFGLLLAASGVRHHACDGVVACGWPVREYESVVRIQLIPYNACDVVETNEL